MAKRAPSSVATYLRSGKRPGAVAWKGGRGRQGPLGAWLLREQAAILEGRNAVPPLTWREIGDLALADGVTRPDGAPYPERDVAKTWSNLLARKLVGRQGNNAATGSASSVRGQDEAGGADRVRPPAPMPPSTAVSPETPQRTGEAASKEPAFTARSILPRRRFGDDR